MEQVDLLVTTASVVTVDPADTIYAPGAIAVRGERIIAVGPAGEVAARYSAAKRIDAPRCHAFPGLINTHNHLWQTLLKGLGDDMPLMAWIDALIVPTLPLIDDEAAYLGAALGALEAARSGCTTTLDFMHHVPGRRSVYDAVFQAFEDVGGHVVLGRALRDRLRDAVAPDPTDLTFDQQIEHVLALASRYGRDRVWLAPSTVWAMTEEGLKRTRTVADETGLRITIHMNEVAFDSEESEQRFGTRSLPYLAAHGFLEHDVLHAHCVWSDAEDIRLLAHYRCPVSYNPISNMYLGSGVPPIVAMRDAGVRLSLATDGAASNNSQDMLEALKFGALLQKVTLGDPTALTAPDMLRMATVGGADALGRTDLGQIAPGMRADFFLFDPLRPKSVPLHNPISTLVYSSGQGNVVTTVAGGRVVLEDGAFRGVDETALLERAQTYAAGLARRAAEAQSR
ncbi:MAG: amidohydrolase [Chloroflexi bacterium]|nr:amidohydrolase [Chloroflexota bacterium]